MVQRSRGNPRWKFAVRLLRPTDIEVLATWMGGKDPADQALEDRIYQAFSRHYHHCWHSRRFRSWVMTINKRPVFCLTLLELTEPGRSPRQESGCDHQLYLLPSPSIGENDHKLRLAWQAASIHVFLRLGLEQVQVGVDASKEGENEALLMMGYRRVETTREGSGTTYLYVCKRGDFRPVL